MAKKESAGILPYRFKDGVLQFFLVHPGGPFWKHKDQGAWSLAKGELDEGEELLVAAKREFEEEVGVQLLNTADFIPLDTVKMKSGKIIHAFAVAFDFDETQLKSNLFDLEWPPKTGKMIQIPEVDKGEWFNLETASLKVIPVQQAFLERLDHIIRHAER